MRAIVGCVSLTQAIDVCLKRCMEKEVWKDVVGFEGKYQVSSLGRVRSLDRVVEKRHPNGTILKVLFKGRMLSLSNSGRGYHIVELARVKSSQQVHRLVAMAFLGNPTGDKKCVNHKDFNKLNNCVDNLEWVSYAENNRHSRAAGRYTNGNLRMGLSYRGSGAPRSKLTDNDVRKIRRLIKIGKPQRFIAKKFNVDASTISDINRKKTWGHLK